MTQSLRELFDQSDSVFILNISDGDCSVVPSVRSRVTERRLVVPVRKRYLRLLAGRYLLAARQLFETGDTSPFFTILDVIGRSPLGWPVPFSVVALEVGRSDSRNRLRVHEWSLETRAGRDLTIRRYERAVRAAGLMTSRLPMAGMRTRCSSELRAIEVRWLGFEPLLRTCSLRSQNLSMLQIQIRFLSLTNLFAIEMRWLGFEQREDGRLPPIGAATDLIQTQSDFTAHEDEHTLRGARRSCSP